MNFNDWTNEHQDRVETIAQLAGVTKQDAESIITAGFDTGQATPEEHLEWLNASRDEDIAIYVLQSAS